MFNRMLRRRETKMTPRETSPISPTSDVVVAVREATAEGAHQVARHTEAGSRWRGWFVRPVTLAGAAMAAGAVLFSGLAVAPSASADPSVAPTARQAELSRMWKDVLGRSMDTGAVSTFSPTVAGDCQQGLLTAVASVAGSAEFAGRYRTDTDRTRALYRLVLGREGEEAGVVHHATSMYTGGRSVMQVAMSMEASQEGRARLLSICAGAPSSNAMVLDTQGTQDRIDQLSSVVYSDLAGCGAVKGVIMAAGKITIDGVPIGKAAAVAGKITARASGANTMCTEGAELLAAIAYMDHLTSSGEPVYSRAVTWLEGCDQRGVVQAGSSPLDTRQVTTRQRLIGPACILAHH